MRRTKQRAKRVSGELLRAASGGIVGLAFLWAGGTGVLSTANRAGAAEDWRRFLEALDERGYGDVAVDYLKSLQKSETAPPELAAELDLRLGLAALRAASDAPTSSIRAELVAQARGAFEKFLSENPDSPSADEANAGLGRLLLDEGSRSLATAAQEGLSDAERERATTAARLAFSNAKPRLEAAFKSAFDKAKELQESSSADKNELERAEGAFLDLTIRRETLRAQTARTFPKDSPDWKEGLTKARTNFGTIFETYRRYAGGFQARFLEAEIARELGDVDAALVATSELAILPFDPQFYSLKTRALLLFAEIAVERDDPADLTSVVKKFNDWKDGERLPKAYYSSVEGLRIRLLAARATIRLEELRRSDYDAFAAAGKKTFTDSNDETYKLLNLKGKTTGSNRIVVFALENLGEVARTPGPDAAEARELLKNPLFEGIDVSKYSFAKAASDFDEAVAEANRAAAALRSAKRDANGADPEFADEARKRVAESASAARSAFQKAFELADDETPGDALDSARFRFAAVCFEAEQFDEAFAESDKLVQNPNFQEAPTAAIVALRSLQALAAKARRESADDAELAEIRQKAAEYAASVAERWGGVGATENASAASAAQEAAVVQIEIAIADGNVAESRETLEKIPESSPRRADVELRLGGFLWAAWNERKNDATEIDSVPENADAEAASSAVATREELLAGAEKALYDGLERKIQSSTGVSESDETTIYYVFLLAQVFEAEGKLADAENWLKHPKIGPLTFVEKRLAAASNDESSPENADSISETSDEIFDAPRSSELLDDNFQTAVLATQLSLITANPERLSDAERIVDKLEELVARSPENAEKLTGVYLRLGKRFEERLRELKDAADKGDSSKEAELSAASQGFEAFLKRAAERGAGTEGTGAGYATARWIADSFLSLGRGLSGTLSDPPPQAIDYFARAGRTYQSILKKIDVDPTFAPKESAKLAVSLKIVECLRSAGAFSKAFDQAKKLIKEAPNNLDVQLETARTLQSWGRKDPRRYLTAIVGGAPDEKGRFVVWGWNGIIKKLAAVVDKGERYKEAFYDAYLEKTLCRYLYVRRLTDKEELAKQARDAENDLRRLYQTRPDLGGPATFAKLDSAFKNFQKTRGETKPIGLRADAKKNAVAPAPAPTASSAEEGARPQ